MDASKVTYPSLWDSWNSGNLHKWDHYMPIYENLLAGYERCPDLSLLEIGVQRGGSLQMHKQRFPQVKIVGLDIDPNCKIDRQVGELVIGDQASQAVIDHLVELGPYDIIIDDGGHTPDQQITSFYGLFPHLRYSGIYIVEDVFTNAIPGYTASRYGLSFQDVARGLADKMGWWMMDKECFRRAGDGGGFYSYNFNNFAVTDISSISFYNGLIAIQKMKISAPRHRVR
jgi:hypothetical protein